MLSMGYLWVILLCGMNEQRIKGKSRLKEVFASCRDQLLLGEVLVG
jgi:hypothetical protein